MLVPRATMARCGEYVARARFRWGRGVLKRYFDALAVADH